MKKINKLLLLLAISAGSGILSGCGGGGGVQAKEADKASNNAVPVEVATVGPIMKRRFRRRRAACWSNCSSKKG
jgi:hypothetical protein